MSHTDKPGQELGQELREVMTILPAMLLPQRGQDFIPTGMGNMPDLIRGMLLPMSWEYGEISVISAKLCNL